MNALPRILAVDDDPAVRELLEDYLSDNGFAVLTAAETQTARKVLEEHAVSAVLLDVGLPGMSGRRGTIAGRDAAEKRCHVRQLIASLAK